MSFRFHLSVSFRSKPNSKRISTPSLVLHTYIYIFSCGSRKRMKILFRRYYRYFSSLSFFFLRKSLKFSLLRFYNKLVHHELLFSSNSNLVTVLIVHEMLRCKSVESFGRSQYTTFLLLIVEIAFDNQSREKNIRNYNYTSPFLQRRYFSKICLKNVSDACYNLRRWLLFILVDATEIKMNSIPARCHQRWKESRFQGYFPFNNS